MIKDLKSRELEALFRKLKIESVSSTHHVRGFLVEDGKKVLPVHYSKGRKGLHGPSLHKFRKSLLLDQSQFEEIVECTFSRDDLISLLKSKGFL